MTLSSISGARFSKDRTYRHLLWRRWNESLPWLMLIGLNPSKAGEVESDPTITRQIERAKILNCGGLLMTNAYDLVSTDPKVMLAHPRPLSEENDESIHDAMITAHRSGGKCIAGWGKHCKPARARHIIDIFATANVPLYCLGMNGDGSPRSPTLQSVFYAAGGVCGVSVPVLRPYQERDTEQLRVGFKRFNAGILCQATGSGKGTLSAWMVRRVTQGGNPRPVYRVRPAAGDRSARARDRRLG